jgi:hypothetical protein
MFTGQAFAACSMLFFRSPSDNKSFERFKRLKRITTKQSQTSFPIQQLQFFLAATSSQHNVVNRRRVPEPKLINNSAISMYHGTPVQGESRRTFTL